MNLHELQNLLSHAPISLKSPHDTEEEPQGLGNLSLQQAIEIYHDAYFTRLTATLHETFNTVQRLMGGDSFKEVCHHYISSRPSTDYLLTDYGQSFPDFLTRSTITQERPLLAELARFEWQVQRIDHTPAQESIATHEVQKLLQEEDCRVHFIEAMVIFQSSYGVYDFWRNTLDPQKHPENLLIFKRHGRVHVERLQTSEMRLIKLLQEGHSLSYSLNEVSGLIKPGEMQSLLQRLADWEIIDDLLILET